MTSSVCSNKKFVPILTLSVSLLGASPALAQQDIVTFTNINPADTMNSGSSYTLGYEFHVTVPITIVGLSVFTANPAAGLSASIPVGLWNSSASLLASTTVLAGTVDPLTSDGFFRWATTQQITLQAGNYYVGAEFMGGGDNYTYNVSGLSSIPGVTFVQNQLNAGGTLAFPGLASPVGVQNGFFGGNVVVTPVPEPGTLTFAGFTGLATLLAARRRN